MNAIKRLFSNLMAPAPSPNASAIFVYVQGKKCGAITRVRINRMNDLSRDDDGDSFVVRKGIVDDVCFGQVEITLRFDTKYTELSREIEGGEFTTEEAYESWLADRAAT